MGPRRASAGWSAFLVVLVLGVVGAGAVVVSNTGGPSDGRSSALLATGVAGGIGDTTTTTVASVPVSYVVPQSGLLAFHLQSNRVDLCSGGGPPLPMTANLHASTTVLAAR